MKFSAQTLRPWILSASFGFIGWLAGAVFTTNSSSPERLCGTHPPPISPSSDEPFVAADAKGNITLHVEHQPISWVLEQIWLQSGKTFIQTNHSPQSITRTESASLSPQPPLQPTQSGDELLTKIQDGDESERYDHLALAHQQKIELPKEVLKTLYETDQSPHVRLLAYTYAMETFRGDSVALRDTLENARSLPDSAIAQDADHRLAVLMRLERAKAEYTTQ